MDSVLLSMIWYFVPIYQNDPVTSFKIFFAPIELFSEGFLSKMKKCTYLFLNGVLPHFLVERLILWLKKTTEITGVFLGVDLYNPKQYPRFC